MASTVDNSCEVWAGKVLQLASVVGAMGDADHLRGVMRRGMAAAVRTRDDALRKANREMEAAPEEKGKEWSAYQACEEELFAFKKVFNEQASFKPAARELV